MNLTAIIPRPIRDIVQGICPKTYILPNNLRTNTDPSTYAVRLMIGVLHDCPGKYKNALFRIAACSAAVFAVLKAGSAFTVASAALGCVLSVPCVAIIGGSALLYNGTALAVSSFATNSFANIGLGALYAVVGWYMLENHDILPIGILELF